jgi:hypothetical protein
MDLIPLDTLGGITLALDPDSRDLVLILKTHIGSVTVSLTAEKACALGVSLIRESGKRHVIPIQPEEASDDKIRAIPPIPQLDLFTPENMGPRCPSAAPGGG